MVLKCCTARCTSNDCSRTPGRAKQGRTDPDHDRLTQGRATSANLEQLEAVQADVSDSMAGHIWRENYLCAVSCGSQSTSGHIDNDKGLMASYYSTTKKPCKFSHVATAHGLVCDRLHA